MSFWVILVILGVLASLTGVMAIINPFVATIAVVSIAAWVFIFIGVMQVIASVQLRMLTGWMWSLLLGFLLILVGAFLISNPIPGVVSLTVLVGVVLLAAGTARIILGLHYRGQSYWWVVVLSGAISIILAIMILTNLPFAAANILGILIGVELSFSGFGLIAFGFIVKRLGGFTRTLGDHSPEFR